MSVTSDSKSPKISYSSSDTKCRRCGGTGLYSKGTVVNGVCFGCGGNGVRRPRIYATRVSRKVTQWVIVNQEGHHLAISTDRAELETKIWPLCAGATAINEYAK